MIWKNYRDSIRDTESSRRHGVPTVKEKAMWKKLEWTNAIGRMYKML